MTAHIPDFTALLSSVPAVHLTKRLARVVPDADLHTNNPPDFLYTSGRPNRYNTANVLCVYFSEDKRTAEIEFESQLALLTNKFQPRTTFWADVNLHRVVDLSDPATLTHLGLVDKDLREVWRGVASPAKTQLLGAAVAAGTGISAIRCPSVARKKGKVRYNIVMFKASVAAPDEVRILGRDLTILDVWPKKTP